MKLSTVAFAALLFLAVGDGPDLNALLDERVKINQQYKKENVEDAKEARNVKLMTESEAGVADSWLELLAYAKQSDDDRLKKIVLRLDYYEELRSYVYDKEYSETPDEHRDARLGVAEYQAKIKAIAE